MTDEEDPRSSIGAYPLQALFSAGDLKSVKKDATCILHSAFSPHGFVFCLNTKPGASKEDKATAT